MGICYYRKLQKYYKRYGIKRTESSLSHYKNAERLLLVGAQKNDSEAQLVLGLLYLHYGKYEVSDDDYLHNKAYEWLKKAADGGGRYAEEAKKLLWEFRRFWPNKPI